jgi:hypothetical protein
MGVGPVKVSGNSETKEFEHIYIFDTFWELNQLVFS